MTYESRFGRVYNADNSVELVSAGLAWVFTSYSNDRMLEAAEAEARRAKRGGWADPTFGRRPVPASPAPGGGTSTSSTPKPLVSTPAAVAGPFHGNTSSRVYHRATCRNYACKNCTAVFASEDDARKAGYKPAGDCLR